MEAVLRAPLTTSPNWDTELSHRIVKSLSEESDDGTISKAYKRRHKALALPRALHGAGQMIAGIDSEKRSVVQLMLARAISESWTQPELVKRLKEVIPLTAKQAMAVQTRRTALTKQGVPPQRIDGVINRLSSRMARNRATIIAQHEKKTVMGLAQRDLWAEEQATGKLDPAAKWKSVAKVGCCPICKNEDGTLHPMTDAMGPPWHPNCRCTAILTNANPEWKPDPMNDIAKAITPGGRVGDASHFSTSTTSNWVARTGGLPTYILEVAHALILSGHPEGEAIGMAVGTMKRWASGASNVSPKVRAAAVAALAEFEAKRVAAHAESAGKAIAGKDSTDKKSTLAKMGAALRGISGDDVVVDEMDAATGLSDEFAFRTLIDKRAKKKKLDDEEKGEKPGDPDPDDAIVDPATKVLAAKRKLRFARSNPIANSLMASSGGATTGSISLSDSTLSKSDRKVATPDGAKFFKVPIGTPITAALKLAAKARNGGKDFTGWAAAGQPAEKKMAVGAQRVHDFANAIHAAKTPADLDSVRAALRKEMIGNKLKPADYKELVGALDEQRGNLAAPAVAAPAASAAAAALPDAVVPKAVAPKAAAPAIDPALGGSTDLPARIAALKPAPKAVAPVKVPVAVHANKLKTSARQRLADKLFPTKNNKLVAPKATSKVPTGKPKTDHVAAAQKEYDSAHAAARAIAPEDRAQGVEWQHAAARVNAAGMALADAKNNAPAATKTPTVRERIASLKAPTKTGAMTNDIRAHMKNIENAPNLLELKAAHQPAENQMLAGQIAYRRYAPIRARYESRRNEMLAANKPATADEFKGGRDQLAEAKKKVAAAKSPEELGKLVEDWRDAKKGDIDQILDRAIPGVRGRAGGVKIKDNNLKRDLNHAIVERNRALNAEADAKDADVGAAQKDFGVKIEGAKDESELQHIQQSIQDAKDAGKINETVANRLGKLVVDKNAALAHAAPKLRDPDSLIDRVKVINNVDDLNAFVDKVEAGKDEFHIENDADYEKVIGAIEDRFKALKGDKYRHDPADILRDHFAADGGILDAPSGPLLAVIRAMPERFDVKKFSKNGNVSSSYKIKDLKTGEVFFSKDQGGGADGAGKEDAAAIFGNAYGFFQHKVKPGDTNKDLRNVIIESAIGKDDVSINGFGELGRSENSVGEAIRKGPEPESFMKMVMFDYLIANDEDRHYFNFHVIQDKKGGMRAGIIDHGRGFGGYRADQAKPAAFSAFDSWLPKYKQRSARGWKADAVFRAAYPNGHDQEGAFDKVLAGIEDGLKKHGTPSDAIGNAKQYDKYAEMVQQRIDHLRDPKNRTAILRAIF